MSPTLTFVSLIATICGQQKVDDVRSAKRDEPAKLVQEDFKGTLETARQTRLKRLQTLGSDHPDVQSLTRWITYLEEFIPLKDRLDKKEQEVAELKAQMKQLLDQKDPESTRTSTKSTNNVEQKLDTIIRHLEQMDKRLNDLEKSKLKKDN